MLGLPRQFEDEEAMYEEDTPQILRNKELTKMTVKTHQMCLLVQLQKDIFRLQRDSYQK